MSGSTMIMAPAVEPASSLTRSQSGPDMLSLARQSNQPRSNDDASAFGSPSFEVPSFNTEFELDTSFSADRSLPPAPTASVPIAVPEEPVERSLRRPSLTRQRTNSLIERSRGWLPTSKSTRDTLSREAERPSTSVGEVGRTDESPRRSDTKYAERGLLSTESFASFAKRSWMTSSRSPSPRGRSVSAVDKAPVSDWVESNISSKLTRGRKRTESAVDRGASAHHSPEPTKSASRGLSRASSYLAKLKPSSPGILSKQSNSLESDNSCASSTASIPPPGSTSIDTCTSHPTSCEENAAAISKSSNEMPDQTRDVLWSSFKSLDVELTKSASKPPGVRIHLLQSQLLPFLKSTMSHNSNKHLRAELVDMRTTILGKWWQAVLEILEGQAHHALSGADRSMLLEAAAMIMMRTEWRQTTSRFRPLADRPSDSARARSWTESSSSSLSSEQAAFLAESAEHNVRTTFISNLMRQMAFVVDKMSLRHVPPNLVNFAAKTCAYAFFFAPGVADILVRLWGLTPQLIRRAADEFGLPRANSTEAMKLAALFPANVESLVWTSSKTMWNTLKQVPQMSLLVARVSWTGPWVSRWKGRDTDLFFIFCKYFHILSEQFMPEGLSLKEKAASPGFMLLQSQLLSTFDTTIHRQSAVDAAYGLPLLDSLNNADVAATALPLPSSNLMKGMSENRLLVLLKDFFSDNSVGNYRASHTFAEALAFMLKAATKKISQYDSPACFTLFDLLEELLGIYSDFEAPDGSSTYIDWNFWLDVCKRVLSSLNTMLEIRLFSFIFTIWGPLTKDPLRKKRLCLDWLLTEDMFHTYFNHWCPMVRAYYQRLLCWRICRDEGKANEIDEQIFMVASERLRTVWGYYLYLKETAEQAGKPPPSSAPMLPSPGKKFMIIRQEQNSMQPGLMVGFDTFAKLSDKEEPYENPFLDNEIAPKGDNKKRWSILGKVMSFSGGDSSSGAGGKLSWNEEFQLARRETAESRSRQAPPPPPPKITLFSNHSNGAEVESLHSPTLFDEPKYVFKFTLAWHQQTMPMRDRILTRPFLPRPAHAKLHSGSRNHSPRPSSPDFPPPTRTVSGGAQTGLVNEAKNASPLSSPVSAPTSFEGILAEPSRPNQPHTDDCRSSSSSDDDSIVPGPVRDTHDHHMSDFVTRRIKPVGAHARNSIYVGRALAEWGIVVFDCNNFVDRRRDEGVPNLKEVEVPSLSLEGFRKLAG